MRPMDLQRLLKPFPDNVEPSDSEAYRAIGIELPTWSSLRDEIFGDLAEERPYGIRWWAPHLDTKQRILIGDQLYCCADSVVTNMVEAALHRLEFSDAVDLDRSGQTDSRCPYGRLVGNITTLHEAGTIRALASALDCLAGVIIGVAAIPRCILIADFKRLRRDLGKANLHNRQQKFAEELDNAIVNAGPNGWVKWTLDFRNMLVHRGRRLRFYQRFPDGSVLHLPRDPARSDVDVLREGIGNLVLEEDAVDTTIPGLINSTAKLLESSAESLLELWRWRRDHPGELPQPAAQWPDTTPQRLADFLGYDRGSAEFAPTEASSARAVRHRFRAAALDDGSRHLWDFFD